MYSPPTECLKHEVEESNTWLNDTTERYEVELNNSAEREARMRDNETAALQNEVSFYVFSS